MVDPEEEVQEEEIQVAARSDLENGNILRLAPDDEIRTIPVEEAVSNQVVSEEAGDRKEGDSVYPEYWWGVLTCIDDRYTAVLDDDDKMNEKKKKRKENETTGKRKDRRGAPFCSTTTRTPVWSKPLFPPVRHPA